MLEEFADYLALASNLAGIATSARFFHKPKPGKSDV